MLPQTDSWVSEDNHFCAGVGVSGKGDVYLVGGERENMQMRDGRYSIAVSASRGLPCVTMQEVEVQDVV